MFDDFGIVTYSHIPGSPIWKLGTLLEPCKPINTRDIEVDVVKQLKKEPYQQPRDMNAKNRGWSPP